MFTAAHQNRGPALMQREGVLRIAHRTTGKIAALWEKYALLSRYGRLSPCRLP